MRSARLHYFINSAQSPGWLAEIDKLDLPRLDVTLGDVLRWARATFPSRRTRASV